MKYVKKISHILILLLLSSCASQHDPDVQNVVKAETVQEVTCQEGVDCQRKWSRAIEWVRRYSAYKIKILHENLIVTKSGASSLKSTFNISKYATGSTIYTIHFESHCNNMLFACDPPEALLKAHFNYFITHDTK